MSDQKAESFETPERSAIPEIMRGHVSAMEASGGEPKEVWVLYNMEHLLLRTIGRKSGRVHKVALPYWNDEDGHAIVVGSYAGNEKHPAWFLNIRDRKQPELYMKTRHGQWWTEPELLEGEERRRIWDAMTEDRPFYRDYQELCPHRELPVLRLAHKRPADGPPPD